MLLFFDILLFILVALFGYTWMGYPVLLAMAAKHKGRSHPPHPPVPDQLPHISVILAAYNEEDVIAERIRNLQTIDYPLEKLSVYLGTDGCTDNTASVAEATAHDDARFMIRAFTDNRGKVAVLRDLVEEATISANSNHLLLFTDANTMFAENAIQRLVQHFTDPQIGGVCGRLMFTQPENSFENPAEEGAYWRLETKLKTWESALDSCLGANGAIYAMRPALFWRDIPSNTIVDDFVIGMKIREQGLRVSYDPEAIATEELPAITDEWARRVRIGAGDFQAALLCKACLHPRFGAFAWSFWSHKILRWFTPHIVILMLIVSYSLTANVWLRGLPLSSEWLATMVAGGSTLFLVAGLWGAHLRQREDKRLLTQLCKSCTHFINMHAALFAGFIRFLRGNMSGAWKRTPRSG